VAVGNDNGEGRVAPRQGGGLHVPRSGRSGVRQPGAVDSRAATEQTQDAKRSGWSASVRQKVLAFARAICRIQIGRLKGSVCEGRLSGPMDGASQTYIELWFDGVNIADDLARQGLGQRLRGEDEEEEDYEKFVLDPCSRVKVENVTAINNFRVTFLNHRLLVQRRQYRH
jgi:hypothetical protein